MEKIKEIKKILLIFSFLIPLMTLRSLSIAEMVGDVTIGSAIVDLDHESFKHGEYSGVKDDALLFIGNADLGYRKDANYLDFRAKNAGLDNRSFYLESGRY